MAQSEGRGGGVSEAVSVKLASIGNWFIEILICVGACSIFFQQRRLPSRCLSLDRSGVGGL